MAKWAKRLSWLWVIVVFLAPRVSLAYKLSSEVGIGALMGQSTHDGVVEPGSNDYTLVLDGHNQFQQRMTQWGIRQYGFSQSRLEVGTNLGVTLDATSGVALYGLEDGQKGIAPFLGLEAFSGHIALNTRQDRIDFYEWLPTVSTGVQIGWGACRLLPLVKGGGAVGTVTQGGFWPVFGLSAGAGTHLNCGKWNFGGSLAGVRAQGQYAQIGAVDFEFAIPQSKIQLDLRSEWVGRSSGQEQRAMMTLRSRL